MTDHVGRKGGNLFFTVQRECARHHQATTFDEVRLCSP